MAKPKLHGRVSEFDPFGEKLKTTRHQDIWLTDIVKTLCCLKLLVYGKKVHVKIDLRDEKSLSAQINT